MLFQVVGKDGQVKMYTSDARCVPSDDLAKSMIASGYKCLLDGKVYRPGKKAETNKSTTK